jgi:hypothetical protein
MGNKIMTTIKPQTRIFNSSTGEQIDRDMTAEELAAWEADNALVQIAKNQVKAKQSAIELTYQKLGLTSEEAALLVP